MLNYVLVSISAGILFGVMDGLINANPLAQSLMSVYAPVARDGVNVPVGIAIDLFYGFAMTAIFMLLAPAIPGESGLIKGLFYGLGVWFFRVVMSAASAWMMHRVSGALVGYQLATGLIEMLVIGALIGGLIRLS
ncbi:MAG: hypothetical protein KDJ19_01030 [Hyphomicrobiaceae bacterium]|nr:hypothetical protein [Hyphomicrobiaceae bacterium]